MPFQGLFKTGVNPMSDATDPSYNREISDRNELDKRTPNRLINEKSPYLLQHAYNPVDWLPWGAEAFNKAEREDKPIFLSIGYSTCHWCHVMEKESFEDQEVAEVMNRVFVSIKVDREERPDIDHIYMTVCQMITGGGGWPLNIVMTSDKKPFFAGTYFPKFSQHGRIGLLDLAARIEQLWCDKRSELYESTDKIMSALRNSSGDSHGQELDLRVLEKAFEQFSERFDSQHGGFGAAPKFPTPHNLLFLLRYWKRSGNEMALQMATKTLDKMRLGGIFDHVGFGFHRYSTDSQWLTPHFEKMLYDQAMLALTYTEAYQATRKKDYRKTVEEIFEYVLRDLTSSEGGFYSAEDADSEGEEGKFYLWTSAQIHEALPDNEANFVEKVFNVFRLGNFKDEATQTLTGANILHLKQSLDILSEQFDLTPEEAERIWASARSKLFELREKRIRPHKDDKILTDWNGLMISALSRASRVLGNQDYINAAKRSADFILHNLRDSKGRLLRRYRMGESGLSAHIDDYSFFIGGLLELYEATFETKYLKAAIELNSDFVNRFWDKRSGGFFFTAVDGEELLARQKEIYDGATPSGNSVAAMNLLKLSRLTGAPELESMVSSMSLAFAGAVEKFPSAYTQFLLFTDFVLGPAFEIVVVVGHEEKDAEPILDKLDSVYLPNKVVIVKNDDDKSLELVSLAPYLKDYRVKNNKPTIYVCANFTCEEPTNDPQRMFDLLNTNKL